MFSGLVEGSVNKESASTLKAVELLELADKLGGDEVVRAILNEDKFVHVTDQAGAVVMLGKSNKFSLSPSAEKLKVLQVVRGGKAVGLTKQLSAFFRVLFAHGGNPIEMAPFFLEAGTGLVYQGWKEKDQPKRVDQVTARGIYRKARKLIQEEFGVMDLIVWTDDDKIYADSKYL